MSYECVCYYDPADVYVATTRAARVEHKCDECGRSITPGERYERVFLVYDGRSATYKTCCRCLDLREYVKAHVPCLCWTHGVGNDDALEAAHEYAHEAPGLLFGAYRRLVAIQGRRRPRNENVRSQVASAGGAGAAA
jgi:hypothetical protein